LQDLGVLLGNDSDYSESIFLLVTATTAQKPLLKTAKDDGGAGVRHL
jgi:hypothetical protein